MFYHQDENNLHVFSNKIPDSLYFLNVSIGC